MTSTKDKDAKQIKEIFVQFVIEKGQFPNSLTELSRYGDLDQDKFSVIADSIQELTQIVWRDIIKDTIILTDSDSQYESVDVKDKVLSFYYNHIEDLSRFRSFAVISLGISGQWKLSPSVLILYKREFMNYFHPMCQEIIANKWTWNKKLQARVLSELFWSKTMFLLRYWVSDQSPGFEKTERIIDKTINGLFTILDGNPVTFWKDVMNKNIIFK